MPWNFVLLSVEVLQPFRCTGKPATEPGLFNCPRADCICFASSPAPTLVTLEYKDKDMDWCIHLSAAQLVPGDRDATLPLFHRKTIPRSDYTTTLLNIHTAVGLYNYPTIQPYHYPTKRRGDERRFIRGMLEFSKYDFFTSTDNSILASGPSPCTTEP